MGSMNTAISSIAFAHLDLGLVGPNQCSSFPGLLRGILQKIHVAQL